MSTKKLQILGSLAAQAGNADTLDGKHANEFASASDVAELKSLVGDNKVAEQIATAIDNITASDVGASVFYVNITGASGLYESDATLVDINNAMIAGRSVCCMLTMSEDDMSTDNMILPLIMFDDSQAIFAVYDGQASVMAGIVGDSALAAYVPGVSIDMLEGHMSDKSNPHSVTKSQIGLSNVENKSSETIRGELTKANVTTALGYTPPEQDTVYTHPNSNVTAGTYRSVTVNGQGHVTAGTNPTTLSGYGITDAASKSHIHDNATTLTAGFMSAQDKVVLGYVGDKPVSAQIDDAVKNKVDKIDGKGLSTNDYTTTEKNKLSGIASGAEVNQNAFSNIVVGNTTVSADAPTDTLTLVAGSNVTITPDATNDKITIAATDTVYTHPTYTPKNSGLYKVVVDSTGHVSGTTAVAKSDITALGIPSQDTTYSAATTSAAGLMSAADKTKLDGIATGANKITVDASLSSTSTNPVQNKVIQAELTRLTGGTPVSEQISDAIKGKSDVGHTHEYIATNLKGSANGVAELDANGKILSSQLPSYVDDVIEAAKLSAFPTTGETGKIYIAVDTNKTYRWSGSAYTEISASLALGETSSTAYRGDRGKTAYDHSQTTTGNPHKVTAAQVGAVPTSRTVNGQALSSNIALSASDVGADASGSASSALASAKEYTDNEIKEWVGDTKVASQINTAIANKADSNHTHSSYVNQNAFSNVTVGSTTIAADSTTDTLTIVAGDNITLTPDATNDKLTIAATDTKYTHPSYTARTGVPTANQTPVFGGTFSVSQPVSDATGHITAVNSRTVTIPSTTATTSAAGLMSASDKSKLDGIADGANKTTVDASLSSTSTNPVQNKVVYNLAQLVGDESVSDQITKAIASKSDTGHTHNYAGSSSAGGAANSVKTNLTVKLNGGSTEGTNLFTYNGSTAKAINITPSAIGAAASSHGNHVPATETANNAKFLRNDNTWQTVTPENIGAAKSSHGTHVSYSSTAPVMDGTASVGSATTVARSDHKHPTDTSRAAASELTALKTLVGDTAVSSQITTAIGKITPSSIGAASSNNATTSAAGLMSAADKSKLNATNIAYGTCSTAAATAAKVVTISGNTQWTLTTGSMITVKFTETNTAANPTLNVNSTGAYAIYYNNAEYTSSSSYGGYANRNITYQFDGTYWVFISWSYDSNSDTKVQQDAAITTAGEYPVILAYSTATTKVTNAVKKTSTLKYNPSTKVLTAPTFKGALTGNADTATKATQDASGNVITSTYATKSELTNLVGDTKVSTQISNAISSTVPTVTTANNGQFMMVVNGKWAATTIPSAEGGSF